MTDRDSTQAPNGTDLACRLLGREFAERKEQVTRELFAHAEAVVELQDGYGYRFPVAQKWLAKIVKFVELERECCPFFRFEIVVEPANGPVWLRIGGSESAREFIKDELGWATTALTDASS